MSDLIRAFILRWTTNNLPVSFHYCCRLSAGLCHILNTPMKLTYVWNVILHYWRPIIEETEGICEKEAVAFSQMGVQCCYLLGRTKEKRPESINPPQIRGGQTTQWPLNLERFRSFVHPVSKHSAAPTFNSAQQLADRDVSRAAWLQDGQGT